MCNQCIKIFKKCLSNLQFLLLASLTIAFGPLVNITLHNICKVQSLNLDKKNNIKEGNLFKQNRGNDMFNFDFCCALFICLFDNYRKKKLLKPYLHGLYHSFEGKQSNEVVQVHKQLRLYYCEKSIMMFLISLRKHEIQQCDK